MRQQLTPEIPDVTPYAARPELLEDAPPEEWQGEVQAVHYALGWSLVYFLLDNNSGRRTLTALLQKLADDYCTPTNSLLQLDLNYPGGISALQEDFYTWLNDENDLRTHTY